MANTSANREWADDITKHNQIQSEQRIDDAQQNHVPGYGNPSPQNNRNSLTPPAAWAQQFKPQLPAATQGQSQPSNQVTSRVLPDSVGRALFDNTPNYGAQAAQTPGRFVMTPYGPVMSHGPNGQQYNPAQLTNNGVAHTPMLNTSGATSTFQNPVQISPYTTPPTINSAAAPLSPVPAPKPPSVPAPRQTQQAQQPGVGSIDMLGRNLSRFAKWATRGIPSPY